MDLIRDLLCEKVIDMKLYEQSLIEAAPLNSIDELNSLDIVEFRASDESLTWIEE